MEQQHVLDQPVLDKIEIYISPKITIKLTAMAIEQSKSLNEVILEAIYEHIKNSHQ